MAAEKQRDSNGQFLKTAISMADTGSVTHQVRGHAVHGRINGEANFDGRSPSRNSMVSGNASNRKSKYPRASN
jgi:hypothetical protein